MEEYSFSPSRIPKIGLYCRHCPNILVEALRVPHSKRRGKKGVGDSEPGGVCLATSLAAAPYSWAGICR